jgi:hypothetical protein
MLSLGGGPSSAIARSSSIAETGLDPVVFHHMLAEALLAAGGKTLNVV